jgi:MFS family permease
MPQRLPTGRSHLTLILCTLLHGFTHAYGSMLVPLYYRMAEDLKLSGVGAATLVVTVYGAVYNLGSYAAGVAADRFSRKKLLAIGLLGNAAGIIGIGLCRDYGVILALAVVCGLCGTLFHPSANALVPSHYPKSPGMAIGMLGIGTGLGFFFGPQIAGWRATTASWHLWHVAAWQKPCVELGLAGFVLGIVFLFVAADVPTDPHRQRGVMGWDLIKKIRDVGFGLMLRDFAGVAGLSLAAIYVRNVFHFTVAQAGLFVGTMMLTGVVVNPLSVLLTRGRRRLPGLSVMLMMGGIAAVLVPFFSMRMALVAMCVFQAFQVGSYAVSDAAMLERVHTEVRGRVVGLFLLIAGTVGALGPWVVGFWVDRFSLPHEASAYVGPFLMLGVCMFIAAGAPRFLARLGEPVVGEAVTVAEEISPATFGAVM